MKNALITGTKYRITFDILGIKNLSCIKAYMIIQEQHLYLKISNIEKNKFDLIINLLKPIIFENDDSFLIHYGLINSCHNNNLRMKLEIHNPALVSFITIIITNIETGNFLLKRNLNQSEVEKLTYYIVNKRNCYVKNLIEILIDFISMLKNEIESNVIKYLIEEKYYKSLMESKRYYDKSIIELKEQDKHKQKMKKRIISNTKNEKILLSNDYEVPAPNKSIQMINEILPEENNNNYNSFEMLFSDIKTKSSFIIDETINILLQIINFENNNLKVNKILKTKVANDLKNFEESSKSSINPEININFKSKSSYNIISYSENIVNRLNKRDEFDKNSNYSTKHSSIKEKSNKKEDLILTPKFCHNEIKEESSKKEFFKDILIKLEECKSKHAFLPTNSYFNILHNSIEVVHRKFFEISFDEYFQNVFLIEKDKNSYLKLESLFSFFLYLRNLKNYLLTDENKLYFSNIYFYD